MAWAVRADIVGHGAIDNRADSQFFGDGLKLGKQGFFAEITAVGVIAGIAVEFEFTGGDDDMAGADELGQFFGLAEFFAGVGFGVGSAGDTLVAEGIIGGFEQEGAIDTPRERHHDAAHVTEELL